MSLLSVGSDRWLLQGDGGSSARHDGLLPPQRHQPHNPKGEVQGWTARVRSAWLQESPPRRAVRLGRLSARVERAGVETCCSAWRSCGDERFLAIASSSNTWRYDSCRVRNFGGWQGGVSLSGQGCLGKNEGQGSSHRVLGVLVRRLPFLGLRTCCFAFVQC